jgi:cytoskeletal protein RodZ
MHICLPRGNVDNLGKHLREHREAKGITLEQISRVSNISLSHLHALEEEQYHILPASTFTVGFLRQYARCVGLDPEDVILRYRRATQQAGGPFRERSMERSGKGRKRSIWILGGSVLLLVLLWMVLYPGTERTEERVRTIRIPRASVKEIKKEQLRKELGLLGDVPRGKASVEGESARAEDSAGGHEGGREAVTPTGALEVILQGIEETWVQITVDGEPQYEKTLKPGDRHSCRARERVKLRIGNGTGVRVFYGGRVYENLGRRGDVVNISFPPAGSG